MRQPVSRRILAGIAAAGLWLALGCNDSNDVSGPTMGGGAPAAVNVAGDWAGTYQSDAPSLCAGSPASARLSQQGNRVMGAFQAMDCGINGSFHGSVNGNALTGTVNMTGCTGGAVTGTVTESGIDIQVSEFQKTTLTGAPTDVMPGGRVTLTR